MKIDALRPLLQNAKYSGNQISARCPAHDDRVNSLSITEKDGEAVMYCHAGCRYADILAAFGYSPAESSQFSKGEALYIYRDEHEAELYRAIRLPPKTFRFLRVVNGEVIWNLHDTRKVLYRFPELLKSPANAPVFIVEGEKDVENLRSLGLVATCNPMGAGKWRDEYSASLTGRICFIIPDNDEAGRKHAIAVANSIYAYAKEVRIVDLPDLPEKGDVTDFLNKHSRPELEELARKTPLFASDIATKPPELKTAAIMPSIVRLSDVRAEEVTWLWEPFLPLGAFVIVEGIEGAGKTFVTLAFATAVASGSGFPLMSPESHLEPGNVIILTAEDSLPHTIVPRLKTMNAPLDKIFAIDEPFTFDLVGIVRLEDHIKQYRPKLIIIDPLFSYVGRINLNNDNEIRLLTAQLRRLAEAYECTILGVRHIGKSKGMGDPRNAGLNGVGWRASARSVLLVGTDPDNENEKAIVQTKNNLAPIRKTGIGFEIKGGEFLWRGETKLTAARILSLMKTEDDRSEQAEAVSFLEDMLVLGERDAKEILLEGKKAGFSPKQLRRAKSKRDVGHKRYGFGPGSKIVWFLPEIEKMKASSSNIDVQNLDNGRLLLNSVAKTTSDNGLHIDDQSRDDGNQ